MTPVTKLQLTYLLTHSLTHLLTHLLTYLLTYSLTHLLTYLLTYLLTHLLTHLLTYSLLLTEHILPACVVGDCISVAFSSDLLLVARNGLGNLCYEQSITRMLWYNDRQYLRKGQQNPSQELWSVTCHTGSHSIICHPTQVNMICLNPSQAGRYSIYLPRRDERLG